MLWNQKSTAKNKFLKYKYVEIKQPTTKKKTASKKKEKVRLKYIETNENDSTTYQNLWDAVKAVTRGKSISLQVCLKNQEKSKQSNITSYRTRKRRAKQPQVRKRKEIIKFRAKLNEIENKTKS